MKKTSGRTTNGGISSSSSMSRLKPKTRINLEIYLVMEKKLATIREAVEKDRSTFNLCKDYI